MLDLKSLPCALVSSCFHMSTRLISTPWPISWIIVWRLWWGGRGCQLEGTTTDVLCTFRKCETADCQDDALGIFVSVVPVFRFVFFLFLGRKGKKKGTGISWDLSGLRNKNRKWNEIIRNNERGEGSRLLLDIWNKLGLSRSRAPFNNAHTICTKENHTSQTRSEKKENPSRRLS